MNWPNALFQATPVCQLRCSDIIATGCGPRRTLIFSTNGRGSDGQRSSDISGLEGSLPQVILKVAEIYGELTAQGKKGKDGI